MDGATADRSEVVKAAVMTRELTFQSSSFFHLSREMYSMSKIRFVIVAALLAATAMPAAAQDPQGQGQGRGQGGGRMMAALFQGITLSADQQAKVDSITAKYVGVRQAAMQDQSADQDARRAKMREIMRQQSDEIKTVLTDEQKKVFDKNLEDMRARMQQGGGRPPAN